MRRNSKTTAAILFSLLFAVVISLTAFTVTVSAADNGKDPTGKVDKKELYKDAIESEEQTEGQEDCERQRIQEGIKEGHRAERRKEVLREDPHLYEGRRKDLLVPMV